LLLLLLLQLLILIPVLLLLFHLQGWQQQASSKHKYAEKRCSEEASRRQGAQNGKARSDDVRGVTEDNLDT
jgi:Flp pilus assembly protein TadB